MGGFKIKNLRVVRSFSWLVGGGRLTEVESRSLRLAVMLFLGLALGLYSFYFRTHRISGLFHLYGDQMRDWSAASRSFLDLPLRGTPRIDGGYSLGPVFYWVLWVIYHVIGPWFDHLPHAGGYGLSALHAGAEVFFLMSMLETGIPILTACAISLLIVSSPVEGGLSGTIWNPILAATLCMVTLGFLLRSLSRMTLLRLCIATTLAVLMVQAHTPALFFAGPAVIAGFWAYAEQHRFKDTLIASLVLLILACSIEAPYVIATLSDHQAELASTAARQLADPWMLMTHMRPSACFHFIFSSVDGLSLFPLLQSSLAQYLVCGLAVGGLLIRFSSRRPLLVLTIGPMLVTWLGWSLYEGVWESYYLIAVYTAFTFCILYGVDVALRRVLPAGALLLLFALSVQPQRKRLRANEARWEPYGYLVVSEREGLHEHPAVAVFKTPDSIHDGQADFIWKILGGRIEPDAHWDGIVDRQGVVSFQQNQKAKQR